MRTDPHTHRCACGARIVCDDAFLVRADDEGGSRAICAFLDDLLTQGLPLRCASCDADRQDDEATEIAEAGA